MWKPVSKGSFESGNLFIQQKIRNNFTEKFHITTHNTHNIYMHTRRMNTLTANSYGHKYVHPRTHSIDLCIILQQTNTHWHIRTLIYIHSSIHPPIHTYINIYINGLLYIAFLIISIHSNSVPFKTISSLLASFISL